MWSSSTHGYLLFFFLLAALLAAPDASPAEPLLEPAPVPESCPSTRRCDADKEMLYRSSSSSGSVEFEDKQSPMADGDVSVCGWQGCSQTSGCWCRRWVGAQSVQYMQPRRRSRYLEMKTPTSLSLGV